MEWEENNYKDSLLYIEWNEKKITRKGRNMNWKSMYQQN